MLFILLIVVLVLLLAGGANFPNSRATLWVLALIVLVVLAINVID